MNPSPSNPPQPLLFTRLRTCAVLAAALVLLPGCAGTRALNNAAFAAAGGAVAHTVSDGDLAATVGGAAGGVLLSEGLHYAARRHAEQAWQTGYDQGRSDAVKQQYWLYVDLQRQRSRPANVRLYEVRLPAQRIDGVLFQPSTKLLRIEE